MEREQVEIVLCLDIVYVYYLYGEGRRGFDCESLLSIFCHVREVSRGFLRVFIYAQAG